MFLRVIFQETGNFEKGTIRAFGEKPDGWTKPDEVERAEELVMHLVFW